jgi:hypothetical protein
VQSGELGQAQNERASSQLQFSGKEMLPLNERGGCSHSARHAAQNVKRQSFTLRQPASEMAARTTSTVLT